MNIPSAALSHWHALHAQSIAMLNLAHTGKWDELIEQEMHYVQLVESISSNPITSCPPAQVEQARFLLKKILENENELKALLQSRMDELRNLIGQTGKQQSITSTYGKLSGNILYPESLTRDTQL
ncbi:MULTISPECIES: flagella biosynthesis regulatory protein FliT [Enterobacter]|jgi:flagellar protein FliT|uniref:Flagellar protein FliT n=1 Tax=Enterobacter cancerogenus TaxID=69218 RepID=A0A484Y8Y4_9ENTR|nr:flagella biosynthesis regulatory protein FliT [Enterobacter cancerogenus]KTQ46517.1 flagellar biosynthesis protein FliT [Enterobacter cancerogenus]KTQ52151.1 flagellar biosynthesis protein FliT [Enterobacter cancerogenus]KTQ71825.1 flagellar biosynthesis protein FliT [Enterobacter cancerogenus]KTQ77087.1 flagellar biosynthesis protein FliT [Enterobacter cancerogenus]MRG31905.1 flagella biosynthesis regulatory protein FliT [Enterobacter cancerogenus]